MSAPPMTEAGFAALLARHGALPAAWPAPQRAAALALLDRSEAARALLAGAVLRDTQPSPDAAALARMQARLEASIARRPAPAARSFRPAGLRRAWPRPALAARLRPWLPAGCGAAAALVACALWLPLALPLLQPAPAATAQPELLAPRMVLALAFDAE
ncbi:hypothetical protein [Pseudoroseomonas cervicalis]|uniref:hypothetical protein n=1 Tax=Teichococcus cervicalis TaxID=204525 RepID=UPI00278B8117|nr:hypothetical protein [Pseudoroseomonas cervicalis]MDQ1079649.1 hypothetical protein [Pseudoroseomonas cervicalis]